MFHPRSFAAAAVAFALSGMLAQVHANTVLLSNLDQPLQVGLSNPFVGQSFIAGTVDEPLYGVQMRLDPGSPPSSGIALELEARNADGTVGATLFSNFSSSYDPSGVVTFTANAPFELMANTGYWLVLSDPSANGVAWDFTAMNVYQSEFSYELPSYNTSYFSDADNGLGNFTYYPPSDGPQLFQLIAAASTAVPEPSSWLLLCFPVAIAVLKLCFHCARCGRPVKAM
jgi:hypothetical protein